MENFKSFIKKLKPVSCYKNPNLSLIDRFKTPEKKGSNWRHEFEDWKKEKDPISFVHWFTKGYAFTKIEPWREDLHDFIYHFTLKEFKDKDFDEYTKLLLKYRKNHIKQVRRDKRDELWVTLKNNKKWHFVTLTSYYPDICNFIPELLTTKRNNECHSLSRKIALQHYVEGMNAELVTGIVSELSPKYKYLHSWVEIEGDGQIIAIDPVKNVVMDKKVYDKLFDAVELERIDGETLYEERDAYWDLVALDNYYSKLYLCSRDEALEKWHALGLSKMTKNEREDFHNAQMERRKKEKQEACNTSQY